MLLPQRPASDHQRLNRRHRMASKSVADRFWSKVDKSGGQDACWIWTGAVSRTGYGNAWDGTLRKQFGSHRLAWVLANGKVPDGLCVCHKCDVRACCNPSHMFLGSQLDNVVDRERKGRGASRNVLSDAGKRNFSLNGPQGVCKHDWMRPRGDRVHTSKLSERDVIAIRKHRDEGESLRFISNAYGVSMSSVSRIALRQSWRHVT